MFFLFKQKTAYEMRISDWSSDVCSSDLSGASGSVPAGRLRRGHRGADHGLLLTVSRSFAGLRLPDRLQPRQQRLPVAGQVVGGRTIDGDAEAGDQPPAGIERRSGGGACGPAGPDTPGLLSVGGAEPVGQAPTPAPSHRTGPRKQ